MEEQIPSSNFPPDQQGLGGQITPEQLEQLKARAREAAIMQTYQQQQPQVAPPAGPSAQVVYVKRPLTVAERPSASSGIVWNCLWCATQF
jgi:hypothetical protein